MCGRKTSSNAARLSLFCTVGTDVCYWPDKRSGSSDRSFNTTSLSSLRREFDRCTDKGVVMFGTLGLKGLRSFDDDFSDHMRMQTTEIVEGAGAGERRGIRVVSVERLRPEYLVLIDHRVRNVVVIDPLHRRSHGNRQFRGREGEIMDRDPVRGILRCYRSRRQHRSNDWTNKHCNDDGTADSKPGRRSTAQSLSTILKAFFGHLKSSLRSQTAPNGAEWRR